MNNTITLCGTEFDIERYVKPDNQGNLETVPPGTTGATPIVNIPMMSDYKWQKRSLEDRLKHPDKYHVREVIKFGDYNVGREGGLLTLLTYMQFLLDLNPEDIVIEPIDSNQINALARELLKK